MCALNMVVLKKTQVNITTSASKATTAVRACMGLYQEIRKGPIMLGGEGSPIKRFSSTSPIMGFEKFILNEKRYGGDLGRRWGVESLFRGEDYTFPRGIWDGKIVKSVWLEVRGQGMGEEEAYLILGDFLFAIMPTFLPPHYSSLEISFTRKEYFRSIDKRIKINTLLGFDGEKQILCHRRLLIGLREEGVLSRKILKQKRGKKWESECYYDFQEAVTPHTYVNSFGGSSYPIKGINVGELFLCVTSFRFMESGQVKRREMEGSHPNMAAVKIFNNLPLKFERGKNIGALSFLESYGEDLMEKHGITSLEEYYEKVKKSSKDFGDYFN